MRAPSVLRADADPARRDPVLIFVLALAVRLTLVFTSNGGPLGSVGYDAGVYYAAADALVHGRVPYADFTLLHPPLLMVVLTPFALLGRLTTDYVGFMVANFATMVLAALNAFLVVRVARRLNLSRGAALLGGAFYAVWFGAVQAEYSARLEPLGTFAFLCALLLVTRYDSSRRTLGWAGVALGAAMSVKMWWAAPVLVVLAAQWRVRGRASLLLLGIAAAGVVIDLPFLLAAPRQMVRMVVTDQLGRPFVTAPLERLNDLTTLRPGLPVLPPALNYLLLGVFGVLLAAVLATAARVPTARLPVVLAMVQLVVLGVSPSYFSYYADYPAAALALVVAAAAHRAAGAGWAFDRRLGAGRVAAVTLTVVVAALTVSAVAQQGGTLIHPYPGRQLAGRVTQVRCLMNDTPTALIAVDALSRDLAHGCPNWIDVSGRTYGPDAANGAKVSRAKNARWQRSIRAYLLSGDAVFTARRLTGLSSAVKREIRALPVLTRWGTVVIHRVPHPTTAPR